MHCTNMKNTSHFGVLIILLLCESLFCSEYEVFTHGPDGIRHHDVNDCAGLQAMYPESVNGVYTINPDKKGPVMVFCDLTTDGGGWVVIQRRTGGPDSFFRPWSDYQQGFGNPRADFWLGNENIHRLTSMENMELRVDIEDAEGKSGLALYKSFNVGDANSFYELRTEGFEGDIGNENIHRLTSMENMELRVDIEDAEGKSGLALYKSFNVGDANSFYELRTEGFEGDIGDALFHHNCMGFSTLDVDADHSPVSCAASYHGGWWYNDCETANLNGDYNVSGSTGIVWKTWGNHLIIKTEMKIRPNKNYTSKEVCEIVWKDCAEVIASIPSAVSGIYTLNPDKKEPFSTYCDMDTDGGGWMVIQRRVDGSVNFTRTYREYQVGFGDPLHEFYLGNEIIHRVTVNKKQLIRFDLEDFEGISQFEVYDNFELYSSHMDYKLSVGNHSGTAGDSFSYHNGRRFTTIDNDLDAKRDENCAVTYRGGWWYLACHASNLNGEYNNTNDGKGINWKTFRGFDYSLKRSEMKIKPQI